jgi:hypothetical protein
MIPDLINIGGPWKMLPPGIHNASISEIEDRFAISHHRRHLFSGFKRGVIALSTAGCKTIYLDGSFVSGKPIPKDYDVCWDNTGVDPNKLDPILLDFSHNRREQKKHFFGEFFPSHSLANGINIFLDFFQIDKDTGKPKGIINLNFSKIKI